MILLYHKSDTVYKLKSNKSHYQYTINLFLVEIFLVNKLKLRHIQHFPTEQINIKSGELSAQPSGESVRAEATQRKLDLQDWVLFLTMTNVE